MLPSLENSCHCTCQVGASGKGMPSWALAPPLLWGPEISWEEGKWGRAGWSHVGLHLPAAPQVTPGLCPQMCPRQPQEPGELFLLLPKGRNTSQHPNNYLSLGALTSSQQSPSSGAAGRAGVSHRSSSPGLWGRRGRGCSSAQNKLSEVLLGSFTTGKPNTLDILVVCCEIVS